MKSISLRPTVPGRAAQREARTRRNGESIAQRSQRSQRGIERSRGFGLVGGGYLLDTVAPGENQAQWGESIAQRSQRSQRGIERSRGFGLVGGGYLLGTVRRARTRRNGESIAQRSQRGIGVGGEAAIGQRSGRSPPDMSAGHPGTPFPL